MQSHETRGLRLGGRRLVAVALAAIATVASLTLIAVASPASAACSQVKFLGVRATNEPMGMGNTVAAEFYAFVNKSAMRADGTALRYPASSVPYPGSGSAVLAAFKTSVEGGTGGLVSYLQTQSKKCPQQRYVISGYSQGALVIYKALPALAPLANRIDGVTLFGNPAFTAGFPGNQGTFKPDGSGMVQSAVARRLMDPLGTMALPPPLPQVYNSKVVDYCIGGDVFCNFTIGSLTACTTNSATCPHSQYLALGFAEKGANYLATKTNSVAR